MAAAYTTGAITDHNGANEMIGWASILYSAGVSAPVAVAAVAVVDGDRGLVVLGSAAMSAAGGPIGWNAILRATHASNFFTDLPVVVFPASWQDFGSGVFTLALASLVLAAGPWRTQTAGRCAKVAALCAAPAFAVDAYLY